MMIGRAPFESSSPVVLFRGPISRMKRLYLETVECGVVRVEHRSTKNKLAERSAARCGCTVLICPGVKES
jgi:hypothetical protein